MMVLWVLRDHKVFRVMMVLREFRVMMVRWVLRDLKGFRVMMVLRVFKDLKVPQEMMVRWVLKALLEMMELLVHSHLERNLAR
jgi:hypothetical protein